MTTKVNREVNLRVIAETVREFAGPNADPRGLMTIAKRESGLNHHVDARLSEDVNGAKRAWARHKDSTYKNSPYRGNPELFFTSRGLYQLMVPYHLLRIGPNMDPRILWNPIWATIAAARNWNTIVRKYGVGNLCQMRSAWALGGSRWRKDKDFARRCASVKNRVASMGFPADVATKSIQSFGLRGFGEGPQASDLAKVKAIAARTLTRTGIPPKEWGPSAQTPEEQAEEIDDVEDSDDAKLPDRDDPGLLDVPQIKPGSAGRGTGWLVLGIILLAALGGGKS